MKNDKLLNSISAVIVSYNDKELMARCVAALKEQLPGDHSEIIVVENGSTDGTLEMLREMPGIRLIENPRNEGFPVGCNIGFAAAAPGNDILLINNDAVPAAGAIENLAAALACDPEIGAAGAVSNNALEQCEPGAPEGLDACLAFGERLARKHAEDSDAARHDAWEKRARLTGFAVLVRRTVADRLQTEDGFLLDPRFSPGYFEDDDLGMRIALAGYRQVLCHDAFIYHRGGTGFSAHPEAMERSRAVFCGKWGFDVWAFIGILDDYEQAVAAWRASITAKSAESSGAESGSSPRILELDCGMGVNLAHLKYLYPGSEIFGIEAEPVLARIASTLVDVMNETPEEALAHAAEPGTPEAGILRPASFDLIFAWDTFARSAEPEVLKKQLTTLLKENGQLIVTEQTDVEF